MKERTINQLIELANRAFETKESPDLYARAAAHLAASNAASDYNPDGADVAALLAANDFACATTLATSYSANIADLSHNKMAYLKSHDVACASFGTRIIPQSITPHQPIYLEVSNSVHAGASTNDERFRSAYDALPESGAPEANGKAKCAAFYAYADTYATTRSAYTRAMFVAQQASNEKERAYIFSKTMSARLNSDLNYDFINPGLFLSLMCSTSIKVIAGLLLLAGVAAIAAGTLGALPFVITMAIGASATTVGTGLFIGGFFAGRRQSQLDYDNLHRMDEAQAPSLEIN
jgi:hypothetical protein